MALLEEGYNHRICKNMNKRVPMIEFQMSQERKVQLKNVTSSNILSLTLMKAMLVHHPIRVYNISQSFQSQGREPRTFYQRLITPFLPRVKIGSLGLELKTPPQSNQKLLIISSQLADYLRHQMNQKLRPEESKGVRPVLCILLTSRRDQARMGENV